MTQPSCSFCFLRCIFILLDDGTFNVQIFNIRDTSAAVLYGYEPEAVTYTLRYGPQNQTKLERPIAANIPRQYSLWNLRPETEYCVDVIAFDVNGEVIIRQSATFMTCKLHKGSYCALYPHTFK